MGLITNIISYKIGRRGGRKRAEEAFAKEMKRARDGALGSRACEDYDYCSARGGCHGMECTFPE